MSKKAFITGASRGIGRGIAIKLASTGYDVAFTYHTEEADAISLKAEIESFGQKGFYYQASLEKSDVPTRVTEAAIKDMGGMDVLVCNAGKSRFSTLQALDPEVMEFMYGLNYRSYVLATKVAINHMIENHIPGRVIFISSSRGERAYRKDAIYGSLKAALNRMVQSLAIELAEHGITVNSVAPGATATRNNYTNDELKNSWASPLIPLGRIAKPEDIAGIVSYLISDDASYITGVTIRVDGGLILYGPNEERDGGLF